MGLSLGGPSLSLGPKNRILGALGLPGASDFAMRDLWGKGEQGAWYDPSDFVRYMSPKGPEFPIAATSTPSGVTHANGVWSFNGAQATYASAFVSPDNAVAGRTYEITYTVTGSTQGGHQIKVGNVNSYQSGNGTFRVVITAVDTTRPIVQENGSLGARFNGSVSDISIRELTNISTATLFQDAAGTTPVTAMEQPVGLMLDKRLGLVRGPELFADASVVFGGASSRVSAGVYRLYTPDGTFSAFENAGKLTVGKTYEATFNIDSVTVAGGGVTVNSSAFLGAVNSTVGPKRIIFVADNTSAGLKRNGGAMDVQISNVSFREIPGNHASQTTTTARPLLSARKNLLLASNPALATVGTLGAGGLLPANWGCSAVAGITRQVLAAGTLPDGRGYFDFRVSGTNTSGANGFMDLYFVGNPGLVVAASGQQFSAAVTVQVLAGNTTTGFINTKRGMFLAEFNGGAFVTSSPAWPDAATTTEQRMVVTRTFNNAATTNARMACDLSVATGGTIDLTLRVIEPQLEYGSAATRYQRVNTATDYDWVGFPIYLKYDGVDDFLTFSLPTVLTSGTIAHAALTENTGTVYGANTVHVSNNLGFGLADATGNAAVQGVSGNGTGFQTPNAPGALVVAHVGLTSANGATVRSRYNLNASVSQASVTNFNGTAWRMGRTLNDGGIRKGNDYGTAVVGRILTASEEASLIRGLANKAGITL